MDDTTLLAIGDSYEETHKMLEDMLHRPGGVLHWADTHNCTFGIDKFQLVDFLRGKSTTKGWKGEGEAIHIQGHEVCPRNSAKFLGVTVDRWLNWKEHTAAAIAKGEKWLNQFGRLARTNKGINAMFVRWLYLTIAIPRLLYGADIYLSPYRRHKQTAPQPVPTYNIAIMRQLATVQRRAAIMITGAMKTTASTVLNTLTDLLLIHLAVDKWHFNVALSLATLPVNHPLHKMTTRTASRYVQSHPSPLHELFHTYNIKLKQVETIHPVRHAITWDLKIKIVIPDSKESAIQGCQRDGAEFHIFSDGSLTEKGVGAAAVVYKKGRKISTTRKHLGCNNEHTVYEAECAAMTLGVHAIRNRRVKTLTIHIDNQAAIRATGDSKQGPGKYIIDRLHKQIDALRKNNRNIKITIRWSPGHEGIQGNEEADKVAKEAAAGASSAKRTLPPFLRKTLPLSRSALKQNFNGKLKKAA